MTRDQIDVVWAQAMHDAIAEGEQMTRYRFAEMVSAIQRQRDAEIARAWDVARPESNYGRCIGRLIEREGVTT